MSLQTGKYNESKEECEGGGFYKTESNKCVKCDSSFTTIAPTIGSMTVSDSNGNKKDIPTATCQYYPTVNETTKTSTCYKNDKLDSDNQLCQKVFTVK